MLHRKLTPHDSVFVSFQSTFISQSFCVYKASIVRVSLSCAFSCVSPALRLVKILAVCIVHMI